MSSRDFQSSPLSPLNRTRAGTDSGSVDQLVTQNDLLKYLAIGRTSLNTLKLNGLIVPVFAVGRLQRFDVHDTIRRLAAASRIEDYQVTGPLITFDVLCERLKIGQTTGKKLKRLKILRPVFVIGTIIRFDFEDNLTRLERPGEDKRSS